MSICTETRVVSFPVDEAYRCVLDLFRNTPKQKGDVKADVVDSKEPSYIKAKIPYGALEVSITAQDEKSVTQFKFNFSKWLNTMYAVTAFGVFWYLLGAIYFKNPTSLFLIVLHIGWISYAKERIKSVRDEFVDRINSLFGVAKSRIDI